MSAENLQPLRPSVAMTAALAPGVLLSALVVLSVGWYFTRMGMRHGEAHVPMPVFAIVFLLLCILNSAMPLAPSWMPVYAPIKNVLVEVSTWGLLLAIGAPGSERR